MEKKKQTKVSRIKEIIKIIAEINEKEMKETIVKINKTKSQFFEKIKLTSHQSDSSRKKWTQINKLGNEKGEVARDNTNTKDHKRLL